MPIRSCQLKFRRSCGREMAEDGGVDVPSSFFSTRSTAPEQPLQLMLTLNL